MRSIIWITVMFAVCLTALHAVADPYTPSPTQTPTKTEVTPAPAQPAGPTAQPKTKPDTTSKAPKASTTPRAPAESQPVPVDSDWRTRAVKWFKSTDPKDRRKEMRAATRALKRPCRHCHSRDFKSYQDNHLISQQMMALSAEHDVPCADCHAGKSDFTELGETAKKMWALSHRKKVFCDHCHTPHTRFLEMTEAGKAFKAEGQKGQD